MHICGTRGRWVNWIKSLECNFSQNAKFLSQICMGNCQQNVLIFIMLCIKITSFSPQTHQFYIYTCVSMQHLNINMIKYIFSILCIWIPDTQYQDTRELCAIGYLFEMHLKPKSPEISYLHNLLLSTPIVLKFCTEHSIITAVLCAKQLENYNGCYEQMRFQEIWV